MTTPTPPRNNGHPSHPPAGPNNPTHTAELTALAADLRRLAARVEDLDTRSRQLTDTLTGTVLPGLTSMAADTATQIVEHTDQIQQVLDSLNTHRTTGPPDWPAMTIDQAATAWDELADWVADTLVPWYEITRDQLPDCWALHRPAVLHLSWLHHTYQAAHHPGAAPRATAEWHSRWLATALRAVGESIPRRGTRTCGPGQHLIADIDRARHHPARPVPTPAPQPKPGDQLAERRHWQSFYDAAVAADLSAR